MNNETLVTNFLDTLDQTGFPEERKSYWLERIGSDNTDPRDEEKFIAELQAHMKTLDDAIEMTEAQIAADRDKVEALNGKALPYLETLAEEQPRFYAEQSARFKKDVLSAEKQMMIDVEGVRGKSQSDEIDSIRKKLKAD